ncbi:MAG TPA: CheR family methyltransferase, partial [Patescibacteria group bacterium]|nr:CheR family methyltransferase [Patescibacteria group bacterium]
MTTTDNNATLLESVPVVALGASAGGLDALKAFFGAIMPDTNAAYVVITHRGADDVTLLPEILAKYTTMPVTEAKDNTRLKAGHVYTSPAAHYLRLFDGAVMFSEQPKSHVNLPIDFFFRSLAEQRREKGVCVILSGNGSDGTLGLQTVKAEGGYALVQDVRTAKFGDMPASAIGTGLADEVLRPEEMAAAIRDYLATVQSKQGRPRSLVDQEDALNEILVLVRRRTGSDFGLYKTNTLIRRIERRMNVHHLTDAWDYVRYLQHNDQEIAFLYKEFLIGVTAFFRDEEAFAALEKEALPELLKNKQNGGTVRIWVSGCSTGEEAYSIAMLIQEYMEKNGRQFSVQIFATDLDETAINTGRLAVYSDGIGLDVSEARLERHFIREDSHYRIRKHLREMVIFATQNLVQDPPFTKLDLVSCRNLLIYLDGQTQKRLMPLFHSALRPGGMLFLGSSETIGTFNNIFDAVHARARIFQRKEVAMPTTRLARLSDYSRLATIEPRPEEPDSKPPEKAPSI